MKIIINTTNLKGGGALQVAISFIYECINFKENQYYVFLSPSISTQVDVTKFPGNFKFYYFNNPSRFILFDKTIRALDKKEQEISPDCVFSVFGPTYWKPKSKHIMGFANGLYLYSDLPYMIKMKPIKKIFFNLKRKYHQFLLKWNADIYVVQTEDMKKRFSKFIDYPESKIYVVSSKYDSIFEKEINDLKLLPQREQNEFRFVTISAYYPHKKLEIINDLVEYIKKININIKFVLTLPQEVFEEYFSKSKEYIINVGPVKLSECPYIYENCDALFLPTLVESFSASYPEAMKMGKPILTSRYDFAITVCADAALYFNPYDLEEVKEMVLKIYKDKKLYDNMVNIGYKIVENLPSANQRANEYLILCSKEIKQDV